MLGIMGLFNMKINVKDLINSVKDKSHTIISIDTGIAFNKVQQPSLIKQQSKNTRKLP